ncbi:MAG: Glu-tRNA(Gln) amidotransferase subunit GatD [Planctomycetota bacterium]|jgi:glutamyl-tRNA(Gln) amidotransferase subunit D
MYSGKVQKVLLKNGIKVGDRVLVEKSGKRYEGLLMPRIELGNRNAVVMKLDNGYNIGVDFTGAKISKSKTPEPRSVKEEEEFELGKVRSDLARVRFKKNKPPVSIITTGGTITSRVDYKTGGVTALMSPEEMLYNIPELADFVRLKMLNPFAIMSESMTHVHWQKLAKVVVKELKGSKGVIVTHGTDTLHFTAAALSFMLKDLGKPVVLVGAQRSTDRGSSDGAFNLICSARVALSDMAAVGICMHGGMSDDYCIFTRGTKVRKMHTSRRDAFRPINDRPLAKVWPDGKIQKMQKVPARSKSGAKADTAFEPKVALIKSYPGRMPDIIDFYVGRGYRGLVLEATGLGQVPTYGKVSWVESIKKATEKGVLVCGAAETVYGRLNPNVYTEGRMLKEAEITERTLPGTFLY